MAQGKICFGIMLMKIRHEYGGSGVIEPSQQSTILVKCCEQDLFRNVCKSLQVTIL